MSHNNLQTYQPKGNTTPTIVVLRFLVKNWRSIVTITAVSALIHQFMQMTPDLYWNQASHTTRLLMAPILVLGLVIAVAQWMKLTDLWALSSFVAISLDIGLEA